MTAPHRGTSEFVAGVWNDIVGRTPATDAAATLFQLGGSSVDAARIVARLRNNGFQISLREFYRAPSLDGLLQAVQLTSELVIDGAVVPTGDAGSGSVNANQLNRLRTLRRHREDGLTQVPFNASLLFEITGNVQLPLIEEAVNSLIEHQPSLRTGFALQGDRGVSWVEDAVARTPVSYVDLTGRGRAAQYEDLTSWTDCVVDTLFDVGRPPLLRTFCAKVEHEQHVLAFVLDHIIIDLESFRILWEQFRSAYRALHRGDAAQTGMPPTMLTPESAQERRRRRLDADRAANQDYWNSVPGSTDPRWDLWPLVQDAATDRPGPADGVELVVDGPAVQKLLAWERATAFSVEVVALACYGRACLTLSGCEQMTILRASSLRTTDDLEDLIGWFSDVDAVVLGRRGMLGADFVQYTRDCLVEAVDHHLPYFERFPHFRETDPRAYFGHWYSESTWQLDLPGVGVAYQGEGPETGFAGAACYAIRGRDNLTVRLSLLQRRYRQDALAQLKSEFLRGLDVVAALCDT